MNIHRLRYLTMNLELVDSTSASSSSCIRHQNLIADVAIRNTNTTASYYHKLTDHSSKEYRVYYGIHTGLVEKVGGYPPEA